MKHLAWKKLIYFWALFIFLLVLSWCTFTHAHSSIPKKINLAGYIKQQIFLRWDFYSNNNNYCYGESYFQTQWNDQNYPQNLKIKCFWTVIDGTSRKSQGWKKSHPNNGHVISGFGFWNSFLCWWQVYFSMSSSTSHWSSKLDQSLST